MIHLSSDAQLAAIAGQSLDVFLEAEDLDPDDNCHGLSFLCPSTEH